MASEVGSLKAEIGILIRVAERFFSGVPQPPPPWRLLPESLFCTPFPSQLLIRPRPLRPIFKKDTGPPRPATGLNDPAPASHNTRTPHPDAVRPNDHGKPPRLSTKSR
jgi:hypothetical protein